MNIYRYISIFFVLVTLTGCAADYSKQQILASGSQVQLRSYQTRIYDTNDKIRVLRAVMSTLQDLGFVIDKADDVIGIVSATKLNRYNLSMSISVRPSGEQMIVRANAQYNLIAVEDPGPYQDFFTSLDKGLFLDDNLLANSTSTQNIRVEASKNLTADIGEDAFAFYGQAEKEIVSGTYDDNLWAKAFVLVEGDEQKRKAKYIELRAYQLYNQKIASTRVKKQTNPATKSILPVTARSSSIVTADKMRELISENTMSGHSENGTNFHVFHGSNGSMKGKAQGGYSDSGTWEVTARGEYCREWKNWRDGDRDCFIMYSLNDDKYRLAAIGKSYESLFIIQKGDQRSSDYLPESILHSQ
jgi:hypothetical protein